MNRWVRPLAISMVVHGAVLGSGALFLSIAEREPTETASVFPVSLVFDPSVPGEPGPSGTSGSPGAEGPVALPVSRPTRVPAEKPLSVKAPEAPQQMPALEPSLGPSESTGAGGGGGDGSGPGNGGGGSGHGDGNGGGGSPSAYEPPRLLAGALPLDPDKGVALSVPPEIPVRLRVGADGRVKEIIPEITPLAPAVLDALHRSADAMRFAPARRGGEPVEGWFSMTFVYRH